MGNVEYKIALFRTTMKRLWRLLFLLSILMVIDSCYAEKVSVNRKYEGEKLCKNEYDISLYNGWPAWCSLAVQYVGYGCKLVDPASSILDDPVYRNAPRSKVGSGVRFVFSFPLNVPLPVAYLGLPATSERGIFKKFLYGRTIFPEEVHIADDGKYVSEPVWGLPVTGVHIYRIPGKELKVSINKLPSTDCQSVTDVELFEEDLTAVSDTETHEQTIVVSMSDSSPVTEVVTTLDKMGATRLYDGSFTQSSFLYYSWSGKDENDHFVPEWRFVFASEATVLTTSQSDKLVFSVPELRGGDVGVVLSNSLCRGWWAYAATHRTPILPVREIPFVMYPLGATEVEHAKFAQWRDQLWFQYDSNCSYTNLQVSE